jgi:uncharacterized protein
MKLIQYITILATLLLMPSCDAPPAQALLAPAAKKQIVSQPALWRVAAKDAVGAKDDSGVIYLFGTIHLLPDGAKWSSVAIDHAVEQSDTLTIEVTGTEDLANVSSVFSSMAVATGLPPLSQRVDSKLLPQLKAVVANGNTPDKTLNQLETWAAALRIASTTAGNIGLGQTNAVETVLNNRFAARGKATRSLETITQQFSFFDQLAEADQRAMLNAILRDARGETAQTQRLIDAWLTGDQSAILQQANPGVMATPNIREVLVTKRNQRWADQLSVSLARGERTFVVVGALHLAGKQGVPALMARKGHVVARVQ